jgi:hypothetical protein
MQIGGLNSGRQERVGVRDSAVQNADGYAIGSRPLESSEQIRDPSLLIQIMHLEKHRGGVCRQPDLRDSVSPGDQRTERRQ